MYTIVHSLKLTKQPANILRLKKINYVQYNKVKTHSKIKKYYE